MKGHVRRLAPTRVFQGFTLVELLVVIAIIAILVAVRWFRPLLLRFDPADHLARSEHAAGWRSGGGPMNATRNLGRTQRFSCPVDLPRRIGLAWLALDPVACLGCSEPASPATVEGTLRLNSKPLGNCLVTFFPESSRDAKQ
jgi:prepilin-type N-terminal cleavage/methylation domain-containing protein